MAVQIVLAKHAHRGKIKGQRVPCMEIYRELLPNGTLKCLTCHTPVRGKFATLAWSLKQRAKDASRTAK